MADFELPGDERHDRQGARPTSAKAGKSVSDHRSSKQLQELEAAARKQVMAE